MRSRPENFCVKPSFILVYLKFLRHFHRPYACFICVTQSGAKKMRMFISAMTIASRPELLLKISE